MASLFAEHGRAVLGLCRLLLRDPVEAEDAAQQTFLSAHRSIATRGVPREPAAWLATIARNECRARLRLRTKAPVSLPELPDDLPDPLARAIRNADLDALWAGLAELPRRQRRAFLLRELGGLSYGELGATLGVSRPAVESLLFRARHRLRAVLAGAPVVVMPVTMRDRLAELIPSFEPATAGAIGRAAALPFAAKLATATVGAGLIAAGASEIANRPAPHARVDAGSPPVVRARRHADPVAATAAVAASRPARGMPAVAARGEVERSGPAHDDARHDEDEPKVEREPAAADEVTSDSVDEAPVAASETSDDEDEVVQSRQSSGNGADSARGDEGIGSGDD